jgi:hypothetical protein
MLDKLKYEDYVTELNTKFALAEIPMEIELIEVTQRNLSPQQEIFSLIFSGAKDNFLRRRRFVFGADCRKTRRLSLRSRL